MPQDGNVICALLMRISEAYKVTERLFIIGLLNSIWNLCVVLLSYSLGTVSLLSSMTAVESYSYGKRVYQMSADILTLAKSTLHIKLLLYNLRQLGISTIFQKATLLLSGQQFKVIPQPLSSTL